MGAWGEGPFASDGALDWLGSQIQDPIAGVIKKALEHFLARKKKMLTVMVGIPRAPKRPVKKDKSGRIIRQKASYKTVKMMGRHREHDVAEAAAGLLDEFTPYQKRRLPVASLAKRRAWNPNASLLLSPPRAKMPVHLHLHYMAEELHLYTLAVAALREIINDDAYICCWNDPAGKRVALHDLALSLESKVQYEREKKPLSSSRMRSYRARMKKMGITLRKRRRKQAFG